MKEDPHNYSPLQEEDRFVEAALQEHARLGTNGNDDALIERILVETVDRKNAQASIDANVVTPWKSLIVGVASAAAALTLGVFILQSFQIRELKRNEQEVHFVVRILDNEAASKLKSIEPPVLATKSSSTPIEPTFATVDSVVATSGIWEDYFLDTRFGKTFPELPSRAHRHNSFLISAEEVSNREQYIRFEGRVVIAHDTWRIEAASASVPHAGTTGIKGGNPGEASDSLRAFDVIVTQKSPARSVRAERLSFDAVSGHMILTGVEALSSSNGEMTEFEAGDRLILTEKSYSIENSPEVKYASPKVQAPPR